jgi:hypothetical protein
MYMLSANDSSNTPEVTPPMEVHHHSGHNHGPKTWKSYASEFFMLFFAVFCGFMAEYQLEHMIEGQREKTYVKSMIEDAETDRLNIKEAIEFDKNRILHLDSLANMCLEYKGTPEEDRQMYQHFQYVTFHPFVITPTERTMLQLKNAGGMRLIKSKKSTDNLIGYDAMTKKLFNQSEFYEFYQNNSLTQGMKIFKFRIYKINRSALSKKNATNIRNELRLLSNNNSVISFGV